MVWKQIRKDLNSCPQGVRQKDYFNFKLFLGDLSSHLGFKFFFDEAPGFLVKKKIGFPLLPKIKEKKGV